MCPLYRDPYLGKLLLVFFNDTEVGPWHIMTPPYRLPLIAVWQASWTAGSSVKPTWVALDGAICSPLLPLAGKATNVQLGIQLTQ